MGGPKTDSRPRLRTLVRELITAGNPLVPAEVLAQSMNVRSRWRTLNSLPPMLIHPPPSLCVLCLHEGYRVAGRLPAAHALFASFLSRYQARLAANYLPSLVQLVTTQLERGWIPTPGANALEDGLGWLGQVILLAVPLTARFVRQYPDETRRLFLALTAYSAEVGTIEEDIFCHVSDRKPQAQTAKSRYCDQSF